MIEAIAPAIDARMVSSPRGLEPRVPPQTGDEQGEYDFDDVVERADEGDRRRSGLALAHVDLDLHERSPLLKATSVASTSG